MRTRYMGPGWELVKCAARPTTPATAINMALASARRASVNWSGRPRRQWDYNAPEFGDLSVETISRSTAIPGAS